LRKDRKDEKMKKKYAATGWLKEKRRYWDLRRKQ
jgi:hypothetical protein